MIRSLYLFVIIVQNATIIRTNYDNSSAVVTYTNHNDARSAINHLSVTKWDDHEIYVHPGCTRMSVNNTNQNYKLKARWFLTESEGCGRIAFSRSRDAQLAFDLLTYRKISLLLIDATWALRSLKRLLKGFFMTSAGKLYSICRLASNEQFTVYSFIAVGKYSPRCLVHI